MNDRLEILARLRAALAGVMTVASYEFQDDGSIRLRGTLLLPPDQAYPRLRPRVEEAGYTPFLREAGPADGGAGRHEVLAVPGVIPREHPNPNVNLILFLATVGSVVLTGSLYSESGNLDLGAGLMFAAALLAVLVTHEMGHYVAGRLRGAPVSLPYFIPLPVISLFGTLGAVMIQREPFEDRRTLLEVGVAGPLAGFAVAVPLYVLGLALSAVKPVPAGDVLYFGDSLLTRALAELIHGPLDPARGYDVFLHPIGFGAWIGLLITGINLIPAGQLDGGHAAYAILGQRAEVVFWAMIATFLGLSVFVSSSWMLWTALLFVFGRSHPPALNQASRLDPLHYALALAALLVLILVFVPNPIFT
jgi:Zn-dependent protease